MRRRITAAFCILARYMKTWSGEEKRTGRVVIEHLRELDPAIRKSMKLALNDAAGVATDRQRPLRYATNLVMKGKTDGRELPGGLGLRCLTDFKIFLEKGLETTGGAEKTEFSHELEIPGTTVALPDARSGRRWKMPKMLIYLV